MNSHFLFYYKNILCRQIFILLQHILYYNYASTVDIVKHTFWKMYDMQQYDKRIKIRWDYLEEGCKACNQGRQHNKVRQFNATWCNTLVVNVDKMLAKSPQNIKMLKILQKNCFATFFLTQTQNLPVEPVLSGELQTDPPSQLCTNLFDCGQTSKESFRSLL